jgi:hypothetical protein
MKKGFKPTAKTTENMFPVNTNIPPKSRRVYSTLP